MDCFNVCFYSAVLQDFDTFGDQKRESFNLSISPISALASFLIEEVSEKPSNLSQEKLFNVFFQVRHILIQT